MSHNSVHLYAEQVRSDILCINLRPQAHIVKIVLRLVIRVTYVKQNAIQPANPNSTLRVHLFPEISTMFTFPMTTVWKRLATFFSVEIACRSVSPATLAR